MNKKNIAILIFVAMLFWTCKHTLYDVTNLDDTFYSKAGSNESRRMEGDCTSCHDHTRGSQKITLGGTLYKEDKATVYKNGGVVNLYSQPSGQGTLLKTIEIDNEGNFYSNAGYIFATPYYVQVVSSNHDTVYMAQPLANGACASCHGVSTDHIFAK